MKAMLSNLAMDDSLKRAVSLAGGPAALARAIGGITSQAVSQWTRVPADRVLDVERLTGVSRHELRPDIFGAPPRGEEGDKPDRDEREPAQ